MIHAELSKLLVGRSMGLLSAPQLQEIADRLQDDAHPFRELTIDAELEDAALGGERGISALRRKPATRILTQDELQRARRVAEEVGRAGEELVYHYLSGLKSAGSIKDFRWESDKNAVAPYDFAILLHDNKEIAIDVKSTSGEFDRRIHISTAELIEMTKRTYHIYRVSEASDLGGNLRITEDVGPLATAILRICTQMPKGVDADSFSVDVSTMTFGKMIALSPPSSEQE
jgi:hypothetical protein